MNYMNYYAICFTDAKFEKTRERYAAELRSKNIFTEVIAYSPADIDEDFLQEHGSFISDNPRGYGYYIWKPYIISKTLQKMRHGDILVYGDAGNELPGTPTECLGLFNMVNKPSLRFPLLASRVGWNIRWIKGDLYLRMGFKFHYALKQMVETGRIVMRKNTDTVKFTEEWLRYCTRDYRNVDDSKSRFPNFPFFVEHRHDQSIFSILFHQYGGKIVNFDPVWKASRLRY